MSAGVLGRADSGRSAGTASLDWRARTEVVPSLASASKSVGRWPASEFPANTENVKIKVVFRRVHIRYIYV